MAANNFKVIADAMQSKTLLFIKKAKDVHNNLYEYPEAEYINNTSKVKIKCLEHGTFLQSPANHIQGKGCPSCKKVKLANLKRLSQEDFVSKASEVHNHLYDYSKVVYKSSLTPIIIICKTHGEFSQRPNDHLSGAGCAKCRGGVKLSLEEFITKARLVHGDIYSYRSLSNYTNNTLKLPIECKMHGIFLQSGLSHLNGNGCPSCSQNKVRSKLSHTVEEFIERAKLIHGDKFDYSFVEYKNCETNIKILCRKHGIFHQAPSKHLAGQSCLDCHKENEGFVFSKKTYVKYCKEKHKGLATLYILQCSKNDESFFKIGITARNITERFRGESQMPYAYQTHTLVEGSADFIYDLEKNLHSTLSDKKYIPAIKFGGQTECFSELSGEILEILSDLTRSNVIWEKAI